MTAYMLITGALGGIGSQMAREFGARGYDLFLVDRLAQVADLGEALAATSAVRVRTAQFDLTEAEQRSDFIRRLENDGVRLCGLVNVAGRDFEGGFGDQTSEQVLYLVRLLIEANLDLTHAALRLREPSQRFVVINVCSMAAFYPMPYKALYASAKRFLLNFSQALREEMRGYGNVLALCPAGLPTTPEMRRKIATQGVWGRMTTLSTERVVRRAVDLALQGRGVYIPGIVNRLLVALSALLPRAWVVRYISARWQRVQALMARGGQ